MPRQITTFQLDRVASLLATVLWPFKIMQRSAALATHLCVEARKARVANDLIERLRTMDDVYLTTIGMPRGDVAARIARQLSS